MKVEKQDKTEEVKCKYETERKERKKSFVSNDFVKVARSETYKTSLKEGNKCIFDKRNSMYLFYNVGSGDKKKQLKVSFNLNDVGVAAEGV